MSEIIEVVDFGEPLQFTFDDLRRYSGPRSVGGLAHVFKAIQRALPQLSPHEPPQRREIHVRTAHPGPGVRDGVEMVTRAVTEGRFHHDRTMARTDAGDRMAWWVFEFTYRDATVVLHAREEFVPAELMRLARLGPPAIEAEREQFRAEIRKMAQLVLPRSPAEIYDIV